eukprot:scaffold6912_cov17-Prasinocladus_malaysianus.AAC.2
MGSLANMFRFVHHHFCITQKFWLADAYVYFTEACLTVGTKPYEKWAAYYRKQPGHTKIENGQPHHFVLDSFDKMLRVYLKVVYLLAMTCN